jgi:hypothetical protein
MSDVPAELWPTVRFVSMQVFTGAVPFSNGPSVMAMLAITQGKRPPRPTHPTFTENLWTLMQRCWDQDPHLRPEVSEVLRVLLLRQCVHCGDRAFANSTTFSVQSRSGLETVD